MCEFPGSGLTFFWLFLATSYFLTVTSTPVVPTLSFIKVSWHGSKPLVLLSWKVLCTQLHATDFTEGFVAKEGNYSTK